MALFWAFPALPVPTWKGYVNMGDKAVYMLAPEDNSHDLAFGDKKVTFACIFVSFLTFFVFYPFKGNASHL